MTSVNGTGPLSGGANRTAAFGGNTQGREVPVRGGETITATGSFGGISSNERDQAMRDVLTASTDGVLRGAHDIRRGGPIVGNANAHDIRFGGLTTGAGDASGTGGALAASDGAAAGGSRGGSGAAATNNANVVTGVDENGDAWGISAASTTPLQDAKQELAAANANVTKWKDILQARQATLATVKARFGSNPNTAQRAEITRIEGAITSARDQMNQYNAKATRAAEVVIRLMNERDNGAAAGGTGNGGGGGAGAAETSNASVVTGVDENGDAWGISAASTTPLQDAKQELAAANANVTKWKDILQARQATLATVKARFGSNPNTAQRAEIARIEAAITSAQNQVTQYNAKAARAGSEVARLISERDNGIAAGGAGNAGGGAGGAGGAGATNNANVVTGVDASGNAWGISAASTTPLQDAKQELAAANANVTKWKDILEARQATLATVKARFGSKPNTAQRAEIARIEAAVTSARDQMNQYNAKAARAGSDVARLINAR